jgi:hypothetical protein
MSDRGAEPVKALLVRNRPAATPTATIESLRDAAWKATMAGGGVLVLQAVVSLVDRPARTFSGSTADWLGDGLLALGLALTLPGLLALRATLATRARRLLLAVAALGQLALLVAVAATLAAGHEILSGIYVAGFAAEVVALAATAIMTRRLLLFALVPALVVALALFDTAGAAALGAAWIAVAARRSA